MRIESKRTFWTAAVVLTLVTILPACPPEGANNLIEPGDETSEDTGPAPTPAPIPAPPMLDVKDYWPMAVGNIWEFEVTGHDDGGRVTQWEVVADHSTADTSAWAVQHTTMTWFFNEILVQNTWYYMFREDYFVRTPDLDLFLDVLNNPTLPLPDPGFIILAPRYFQESETPEPYFQDHYGKNHSTTAGPLFKALVEGHCEYIPYDPVSFVVELDYPVLINWRDSRCGDVVKPKHHEYYALGFGPIRRGSTNLAAAIIDGRLYVRDPITRNLIPYTDSGPVIVP